MSVDVYIGASQITGTPNNVKLETLNIDSRTGSNASFDAQYGAVPSDFLETKSLKLTSTNPQTPLEFLSIDALDNKAAEYTANQW